MAIIKKNIWSLFYLILFIGLLILGALVYRVSEQVYKDRISEQENITKVSATSINSIFLHYESMLDILGYQLIKNENYKSLESSREILNEILFLNPSIATFSLANKNGQLYITSSNEKTLPNLVEKLETKDSFNRSLEKDVMVIGRTYFNEALNSLIIPIRKAIRDKNGEVIAVIIAGINVNKTFDLLNDLAHRTVIFRDFDYFYQLTDKRDKNRVYEKAAPAAYVNSILQDISEEYKLPIEVYKSKEILGTIEWNSILNDKKVLSSLKYISRFDLWIVTQINSEFIKKEIVQKSLMLMLLYISIMFILYFLFKNINEHEIKKQKALYYQATHDHLTRLKNRYYLSREFDNLESYKPFSLFFIDMDNFKSINDNYGHNYGDLILKEVALRLRTFKNESDHLIRYSGDEFLLITFRTEKNEIRELALNIIQRLSETYSIEQYQFILGASIGISQYPFDGETFDEIKRYSDIAMYEAKSEKNAYRIFEDSIKHKYLKSSRIEQELKTAIPHNEIYMMYQPQISKDGSFYGVEALVRWENENLGFIPPDEFIKVAEATGQMVKLGHHIIETSIEEIDEVQKLTNVPFQLAINISVKQFMEVNFYDKLFSFIEKINFNKILITLEVTENVFIEDLEYILNLLNRLRKKDVKISLDDFGTGYSSLSLLKKLPIDELKIDKAFVDDILVDEASKNMILSIISIGKKFDMTLLAEGIESIDQKRLLEEYGCDLFQGYYFSKPLKKDDLIEFIKKQYLNK